MENANHLALEAKLDEQKRTVLIQESTGFILRAASTVAGKYITKEDDEWAIALEAFSHSINSYDAKKGNFLTYASTIIRNQMTDHYRKEKKQENIVLVEPDYFQKHEKEFHKETDTNDHKLEIESLEEILSAYGFSFWDLADRSPNQDKTKSKAKKVLQCICRDDTMMNQIRTKKILPMKEIKSRTKVSGKFLDKYRKYLITVMEIMDGDFPLLKEYVRFYSEEEPELKQEAKLKDDILFQNASIDDNENGQNSEAELYLTSEMEADEKKKDNFFKKNGDKKGGRT